MSKPGVSVSKTLGIIITLLATAYGCDQPTTFVPSQTDRFTNQNLDTYTTANRVVQADYLFVLDYSYSMRNKTTELLQAMNDFTGYLANSGNDYHVGLVNGNIQAGDSYSTISTDFVAPMLTLATTGTLAGEMLSQVSTLGKGNQPNRVHLLEAALRTMKAQGSSFARTNSQLIYVFASDADDISQNISASNTTAYYIDQLKGFKSDPSYVSARSFTAGVATGCALQRVGDGGDKAGIRIATVAQGLDSLHAAPGCIYTPTADVLKDLARDVTRLTTRFTLLAKPLPGSVRVFVDNAEVAESGNWSYQASTNEVIFATGNEPAPSANLRFDYEIAFVLTRTPKAGTIAVTSNGVVIPESATDGWSYVPAENRISFNGTSPANGADIRVTYQVQ